MARLVKITKSVTSGIFVADFRSIPIFVKKQKIKKTVSALINDLCGL